MIELRWLERHEDYYWDGMPVAKGKLERVLQYRVKTLIGTKKRWSDWQDVPTVREE